MIEGHKTTVSPKKMIAVRIGRGKHACTIAVSSEIEKKSGNDMFKQLIGATAVVAASLMCAPAMAGALSGNYLITLGSVRPATDKGAQACVTLTDDGSAGWAHSGPWAFDGQTVGTFFVVGGVLTAYSTTSPTTYITFSGKLYKKAITNTAITEVIYNGPTITGNFTAVRGGC